MRTTRDMEAPRQWSVRPARRGGVACIAIFPDRAEGYVILANHCNHIKMQEKGNTNAKFWGAGVLSALGGERHWHQVGLRQLR